MNPTHTPTPIHSNRTSKFPLTLTLALSFVFVFVLSSCVPQETTLLILQTSDTHSCIEPDAKTGTAGFVRRAALVDSLRAHVDRDLLLFDCGDFSQGSVYYNLFQGETEVRFLNAMHYDAATIGNHEFDFGMDNMARIFTLADYPTVCSNYDVSGTVLEGIVRPYTILKRKGLRIGIIGVCPPMEGLIFAKNYEGITYLDPIAEANRLVPILRNDEHCDVIICLSHLGWDIKDKIDDIEFIQGTSGIDLVLGGHTHSNFDAPILYPNAAGDSIPLMHSGQNGSRISRLTLTVTR